MAIPVKECESAEKSDSLTVISAEGLESRILLIRDQKVMLDRDLAHLYGVRVKRLKEQVNRNIERFPEDFMFILSWDEEHSLRSQIATLENPIIKSAGSRKGKHSKYRTFVFTEQGISMLSSVLNSKRAIQVNIAIMRAFVRVRQLISFNKDLVQKLAEIEHRLGRHDQGINELFDVVNKILRYEEQPKKKYGFDTGG